MPTRSRRSSFLLLPLVAAVAATLVLPSPAPAQTRFGVRAGVYTDLEEPFAGLELVSQLGRTNWWINPNFEYVFVSDGSFLTINGDFHYDFTRRGPVLPWVGGGPALIFSDPGGRADSESDIGLNLLAGLGFPVGDVIPYIQGKAILADENEGVLAFGLRF